MFKKFIPPLMRREGGPATVATNATDQPPFSSQRSAGTARSHSEPHRDARDSCNNRDKENPVADVAIVAAGPPDETHFGMEHKQAPTGGQKAPAGSRAQVSTSWTSRDWQAFFDERAGIAEYNGGLQRAVAQRQSFEWCVAEWLSSNPQQSDYGHCVWCGQVSQVGNQLVPYGVGDDATWLHAECHVRWRESRRAQAVEELAKLGISRR
jgi:hypothetical protein